MRTKTQLELLRQLRQRKGLAKGFTLVELLVVVAIVAILSAVVMPRFLGARATADSGAKIGQAIGLAKECSVFVAAGAIGTNPNTSNCSSGGGTYSTTFSSVANPKCLAATNTNAVTTATITIAADGGMSCALS
jgi:type IV pilus assembly protein PilA